MHEYSRHIHYETNERFKDESAVAQLHGVFRSRRPRHESGSQDTRQKTLLAAHPQVPAHVRRQHQVGRPDHEPAENSNPARDVSLICCQSSRS